MLNINDFDFENGIKYSLYTFKIYFAESIFEVTDQIVVEVKINENGDLELSCLDTNYNAKDCYFVRGTWTYWEYTEQNETWLCEEAD
jgi:hypothetical protein